MTAQILGSDLSSLIQESKRKLPELRNVCEFYCSGRFLDPRELAFALVRIEGL